jgi:hypothetical protein
VGALGFKGWESRVDLHRNANAAIRAELTVADMESGGPVFDQEIIPTERQILDTPIEFENLEGLAMLPGHRLRHRGWPHRSPS